MLPQSTFLFSDIEGSTRLWEDNPESMQDALERHDRVARRVIERHGGTVFKTMGDAVYAVFPTVSAAVLAAVEGQRKLSRLEGAGNLPMRVRMAIHTGQAQERDGDYFGASVNRVARVLAIGNGGQILLTRHARESLMLEQRELEGIGIQDLGIHRLRDLAQPEHVFEVIEEGSTSSSPTLKSLGTYPNNLPVQISSFVGREKEMSDCRRLLRDSRLLSLTGVGGSGKTRLALQLAAEMLGPDGAYLVEFAPINAPELVGQSIGEALGLRETAGKSITEVVAEELRTRRTLLVLDNCEHVVDEAADAVRTLLQRCPLLKILVTSREPLGLTGEVTYKVPPLAVPMSDEPPRLDELVHFEAVRLFLERATSVMPDFTLGAANAKAIFDICRSLEGLPLAIELAAARVRLMGVDQIASRLDDQFRLLSHGSRSALPRQQTLRALVDWSYNLLSEDERVLLDRLSVFVSGWTLDAAEAVCQDSPGEDVLSILSRLIDKSLVQYEEREDGEGRYRLLETIRQYAHQRLEERGQAGTLRSKHLSYFAHLAQSARPYVQSGDVGWLAKVSREHDNIRYALDWCSASSNDTIEALKLAAALAVFWANRGHLSEGRARFREVLSQADGAPALVRADALLGSAVLDLSQGAYETAAAQVTQAVDIWRAAGDRKNLAGALMVLGNVRIQVRDLDGATEVYEEGSAIRKELGDRPGMAVPLNNLGYIYYHRGHFERALEVVSESVALCREFHNRQGLIAATHSLAMVFRGLGELDKALAMMRESLSISAEIQHYVPVALRLEGVGHIHADLGNDELAVRLLGAADALRKRIHQPVPKLETEKHQRYADDLLARMGSAEFNSAFEDGTKLPTEEAVDLALGKKISGGSRRKAIRR